MLVAPRAILFQAVHHHAVHRLGNAQLGTQGRGWLHVFVLNLCNDAQVVVAAKGKLAGQALVQDECGGPDIGARVQILAAACLLGRHEQRRAQHGAGAGKPLPFAARLFLAAHRLGHTEIHHLDEVQVAAANQVHVLGFHIAMDDALVMGRPKCAGHLLDDGQAALDRQGRVAHDELRQRLAFEKFHDHEGAPVAGGAEVGDVDDVLVADRAGQPGFLQKARDELFVFEELF